jgi:cobalt-zinc-cadmium resistance protein CzcA
LRSKSNLRFEKGEANVLEKTAAQTHRQQITNQLNFLNKDLIITVKQFNLFVTGFDAICAGNLPSPESIECDDINWRLQVAGDLLPIVELAKYQQDMQNGFAGKLKNRNNCPK